MCFAFNKTLICYSVFSHSSGSIAASKTHSVTVTFPISYTISPSAMSVTNSAAFTAALKSTTTTQAIFDHCNKNDSNSGSYSVVAYIAVGYCG